MADLLKINKEQIRESMNRFTWSLNFLAEPKAYVLESFDERSEYISKLKETYSLYLMLVDEMTESFGKDLCAIGEAINSISTVDTKLSGGIEEDILQVSPISIVKTNYYGSKTIGSRELRSDHIKEIEDLIRTELNIISGKLDNYINEIKAFEEIDFKGMLATSIRSYLQEEHLSLIKKVLLMGEEIIEDIRKYNQDVELILNESGHYVLIESAFVSFIDEVTRDMNEYEDAINEYNKAIMSFMYDEPSINGIPKPKLQLISRAEVDDTLMEYNELREISRRELEGIEAVESRGLERLGLLDTKLNNMRINISEITKDGIANYSNGKNITSFAPISSREEDKFVPEVVIEEMRATGLVPGGTEITVSQAKAYYELKQELINQGCSEIEMQLYLDYVLMFEFNEFTGVAYSGQYLLKAIADFVVRATNRANDYYTNMLLSGNFENLSDREYSALLKYVNCIMFPDVEITEEMLDGLLIAVSSIDNFDQYDKATQIEIIAYLLKNGTQYIEDLGNSFIPENYKEQIIPLINAEVLKTPAVALGKAVEWIIGIANDPSHGYNYGSWGSPDYDCGHLVIVALENGGINVLNSNGRYLAGDTTTMISTLLTQQYGFDDVTAEVNFTTGAGMQPGDILMRGSHAAMYVGDLGDGPCYVDASQNEFGGTEGGVVGDQRQQWNEAKNTDEYYEEIGIRRIQGIEPINFSSVYRYVGV